MNIDIEPVEKSNGKLECTPIHMCGLKASRKTKISSSMESLTATAGNERSLVCSFQIWKAGTFFFKYFCFISNFFQNLCFVQTNKIRISNERNEIFFSSLTVLAPHVSYSSASRCFEGCTEHYLAILRTFRIGVKTSSGAANFNLFFLFYYSLRWLLDKQKKLSKAKVFFEWPMRIECNSLDYIQSVSN